MAPAFTVCVVLGLTVGLFFGAILWKTALAKGVFGAGGLLAGYVSGIGAGLAAQWLGEVGRMLERFAIPAVIGLAVLDIALLIL